MHLKTEVTTTHTYYATLKLNECNSRPLTYTLSGNLASPLFLRACGETLERLNKAFAKYVRFKGFTHNYAPGGELNVKNITGGK